MNDSDDRFVRFLGSQVIHQLDGRQAGLVTFCGRERARQFGVWNFYMWPFAEAATCLQCKRKIEALAEGKRARKTTIRDYPASDPLTDA